jgi:hypothetical protein
MSARSTCSYMSRKSSKSVKSTAKWNWKYWIPGYPWMGDYWEDEQKDPDLVSLASNWSNCS